MCVCFFFACFHAVRYILPRNYLTDLSFDFIPKVSYSTLIVNLHYHKMQLTWHEHDLVFSIHLVVALTNKKDCKSNKNDEHVMHARNWKLKFFWLITLTVVYTQGTQEDFTSFFLTFPNPILNLDFLMKMPWDKLGWIDTLDSMSKSSGS